MTETFAALLLAHALADFVFQTAGMAAGKAARRPGPLAAHAGIVLLTLVAALAPTRVEALGPILGLTLAHLLIDLAKSTVPADRLWAFLADQAAHLATLVAVAAWHPALFATGLWSGLPLLPEGLALAAGLILATRAGGFAVGLLMAPLATDDLPEGLPDGGRMIGLLERGLIFVLVIVNQPAGIGFLIAAKSVLRFDTASKDTRAGEYVIIGTLASFGWAMIAAYATRALAVHLGFPPAIP